MSDVWMYKGKTVKLLAITHVWAGEQYCTILMENRLGRKQRQSVMFRHLTNAPQPASDQKAEDELSRK